MSRPVSKLTEGMRRGDLADLVLPLMSVDEYRSKVDEKEAIVFGFYVADGDAASDLNRFLQKSAVPLLDTEVSPAPDQHGYYMVFVEMLDNERLPQNMSDLLSEVKMLVDIDEWEMRVRNHDGLLPFTERGLARAIEREKQKRKDEDVLEFLRPSALANALIEDGTLIIEGAGERYAFELIELDRLTEVLPRLPEAISLSMKAVASTNRLRRMLGETWQAWRAGRFTLLERDNDPRALLLR